MATTLALGRGWPPMADHRTLRFGMIFLLYIAQGVPLGLFFGKGRPLRHDPNNPQSRVSEGRTVEH